MRPVLLLLVLFFAASIFIESDGRADDTTSPFGLKERIPWTTSRVVGTPDPPPPYTVKRAFPLLTFKNPLYIAQEPGTDRIFVGELSGKIYAFSKSNPDPDAMELFLDIGREMYSFSFHPKYEENGYLFVFSPRDPKDKSEDKKSRVSRFQAGAEHPRHCSPDTETIILEWPAGGHNGGEAIIGPDGYLYISTGDGTSGSDPKGTGQGVDDLFSVIVRIDVD
ncbi:MAG: PQQ-dependent sugar dehydrogenase, partial [Planctomycetes bacterium]|nr:PQQ-dependent sugar dehydrogenase [Planctomycetota bacterium]